MNKKRIREFVLGHALARELFFFVGRRKVNLRKIDRALSKGGIELANEKTDNVIISLTSYGERISELKYTLYSLVVQSIRPERIIVNLAYEDEKYVTPELKTFERYGVTFFFCKDIRSYKKLIPTLERFPEACIITADDDIYYEKNWLKKLYEAHRRYPNDVCCHLVYKITYEDDKINTYQKWIHNYKIYSEDNALFLLGVSGVFYPSKVFYKDIQNEELFMKLAPIADDMWFWFMVRLNGKTIRQIEKPLTNIRYVNPYREYGISGGTTLAQQNVGQTKNDMQFKAILNHYNIPEAQMIQYLKGTIESLNID